MIINPYLVQPSGPSYGTLTTAWIAATGETDLTILGALNTLESDLTTYGLTSKMKALYPFVGGTAAKHKFNFMDARDLDAAYRLVFNGGWTHSSTGALPNGTNAYADTAFNVNTYKDNNHLSYYIRTNLDEVRVDAGLIGNIGQYFDIESRISNVGYFGNHISAVNINFAVTDSRGLWLNTRTTSTLQKVYKNGTSQGSNTASGTTAINGNIYLGARNLVGTGANLYSTKQTAFASIGDGLNDTEAANFYTAVQTFQTTLGRQVGTPIPFAMPLDTYSGAAVAYSAARRLASTYTGSLIRVRRSSDNAEQNIGYTTGNVLDESALTTFVGANNGFVTTWYDQSGSGYNLEQTTAANQPKIVSSGVVNKLNSKASLNFDGSNDGMAVTNNTILHASALTSCFYVSYLNSSGNNNAIASKHYAADGGYFFGGYASFDYMQEYLDTQQIGPFFTGIQNTQLLFTNINKTGVSGIKIYKNSTISQSYTASTDLTGTNSYYFTVGKDANAAIYLTGEIQEIVIYSSDKTTDRTNIEGNLNTFYSIY